MMPFFARLAIVGYSVKEHLREDRGGEITETGKSSEVGDKPFDMLASRPHGSP